MTILSHPHPTISKETSLPHFTTNTTTSSILSPIPLTRSQMLPSTTPSPVITHDIPHTTRITFFPPYDSLLPHTASSLTAHNNKMTTTDPIIRHPAPWVRPTACDIPNPPRKRTTPIRFASNAFHPDGWSPPPSRATSEVDLGEVTHSASLESPTGPAAIVYARVATGVSKVIQAPNKRTEPITFAANSFDPKKRSAPLTPSTSSSTLDTDDGNDEMLLSPAANSNIPRPPAPACRRTDPIGFAVNGWRIDVPAIPLQVDTRVCSPPASPNNTFDWSPVYAEPPQKENPIVPCTKWMTRPVASSQGPASPRQGHSEKTPAESPERHRVPTPVHHVRANSPGAAEASIAPKKQPSDDIATSPKLSARKSSEGSSWYQYKYMHGPISPRLNAAQQVAHEEAMGEELEGLVLEELVVSDVLHPKITLHPRPASPHLPDPLVEGSGLALKRKDTATSSAGESLQRSAAEDKLAEVLSKQRFIASPKHLLEMEQLSAPKLQAADSACAQPLAKHSEAKMPETAGGALLQPLGTTPEVPPSTPYNDTDIHASSPAAIKPKDPFRDWTEPGSRAFDAEAVSAKLFKFMGRVAFDEIDGLGVPSESEPDGVAMGSRDVPGDVDVSNVADLGDSSLPLGPVKSRSTRRTSFPW